MIAYKFLRPGGIGPFSGFQWPLPRDGGPGEWVEAADTSICTTGIHACALTNLPVWLGQELWEIELDGVVEHARTKVVARRGRLRRRIEEWGPDTEREFGEACRERAQAHDPLYGEDAAASLAAGQTAAAAFIAAHAAAQASGSRDGIAAERAWQARWLERRLNL